MWQVDWTKLTGLLAYDSHQPMIFSSGIFLFLFLAFSFVYMLLQKRVTARLLFVTLFSYYFYYKSSGIYFFLLGIVTVSDFFLAHRMQQTETHWKRKMLVVISLCINLGLLCYFKYTNFFYQMLCPLWNGSFQPLDIFLPVGISFFTFQSLSYTIDVYRKDLKPLDNLLDYAFYVSFFPQLVAGPIVRARDFIPQIRRPLLVTNEMFGQGVFFIVSGLFKKAVISDYISVNFVERIFDNPSLYSGLENLFGVYGYALQIYCDFSGYSDIAIGTARLFGINLMRNFNFPYFSRDIAEFWRRWHISLTTWFRDYIYIPLGGSRCARWKVMRNTLIIFLVSGLWHGANWTFITWGAYHALLFFPLMLLGKNRKYTNCVAAGRLLPSLEEFGQMLLTFLLALIGWIIFRAENISQAWDYLSRMCSPSLLDVSLQWGKKAALYIVFLVIVEWLQRDKQHALQITGKGILHYTIVRWTIYLIIILFILLLAGGQTDFIYFQF